MVSGCRPFRVPISSRKVATSMTSLLSITAMTPNAFPRGRVLGKMVSTSSGNASVATS